jgi:outer membrane protein assembly factor BamB
MKQLQVNLREGGSVVAKRCASLFSLCLWVFLTACSSTPEKPAPTALAQLTPQITVTPLWSAQAGPIASTSTLSVNASRLALVSQNGLLTVLNADSGALVWQMALNTTVSSGVGSDGNRFSVITQANELVTLTDGKESWRAKLPASSFTAPLVAGGRVFVLTTDRTVLAFDGASGQKLRTQQRSGDALVLKQAGILTSFQDNLMVGLSGRLVAMSPSNGVTKWEALIGASRGTNEVERLVDLVAGVSRVNQTLCTRSYQTAVSCTDAAKGTNVWTRTAAGHVGLSGNDTQVFGTESDGKVITWNRLTGQVTWQSETLRFRGLTAPAFSEGQLLVGDDQGWLHWLDPKNGQTVARVQLDASGIALAPLRVGKNWISVSKNGLVQAFRAE